MKNARQIGLRKGIQKALFYSSMILMIFWVLSPLMLNMLNLEFNDRSIENSFEQIRFLGLPICVFVLILGFIKPDYSGKEKIAIIVLSFVAGLFTYFIMLMSLFADMCAWTNSGILFMNKEDHDVKIIRREFGCGATDSGLPIVKDFIVEESFLYFITAKEVNIEELDEGNWMKVE